MRKAWQSGKCPAALWPEGELRLVAGGTRMSVTIDVEALQEMLTRGEPVTILDVRTEAERAEWAIPGSVHADVYEALQKGDFDGLDRIALPAGQPVVTVCGSGHTSLAAAERLRSLGVAAWSLAGGMQAWSLAWNLAEIPIEDGALLQVRRAGKGCLSYLIASGGYAAVVDPALPAERFAQLAESRGRRITAVLETHIHADHLSRARTLAELTGAAHYLPLQQRARFPFRPLREGDEVPVGSFRLLTMHTPGHTPESSSYLLRGRYLLTGDTLFADGVGRPDLDASSDQARERARVLHRSLSRLLALPGETMILAAHSAASVPFDGKPLGTTVAEARRRVGIPGREEDEFAAALLRRLPPPPANHREIVRLNEMGAGDERMDLEAGANRCAVG